MTVQVPARSHRCRARRAERAHAVLLRRQCRGWRGALRGMLDRWLVCLMRKLRSTCTGCDMLEYARAQMSCLRVFYLSRVADGCLYNTQIPRHAQPTRSCKIHCTPLAVAPPHLDWRATHQLNPSRGPSAGGASSFGSAIELDELRLQKRHPVSRPERAAVQRTGVEHRATANRA